MKRRKLAGLASLALAALSVALVLVGRSAMESATVESGTVARVEVQEGSVVAQARTDRLEQRTAHTEGEGAIRERPANASEPAVLTSVRAIDAWDDYPVRAEITVVGTSEVTDAHGRVRTRFRSGSPLLLPPEQLSLDVFAAGYRRRLVEAQYLSGGTLEVRMDPREHVAILALDSDGSPVDAAEIRVRRADSRGRPEKGAIERVIRTDSEGQASFPLASPFLIGFADEARTFLVHPWTGQVELRRAAKEHTPTTVRLVDSVTGAPLGGVEVTLRGSGEGTWRRRVAASSAEGELTLPGAAGPWVLDLGRTQNFVASGRGQLQLDRQSLERDHRRTSSGAFDLLVERCGAVIACSVARGGDRVHGPGSFRVDYRRTDGTTKRGREIDVHAVDGRVALPCMAGLDELSTVVVTIRGYRPYSIPGTEVLGAARDRRSIEAALTPTEVRRLELVGVTGTPLCVGIRVINDADVVLFEGQTDELGRTEPMNWGGGDLRGQIATSAYYDETARGIYVTEELLAGSVDAVRVVVDLQSATLWIDGVPRDSAPLVLRTEAGASFQGAWGDGGIVFEGLLPGLVVVGPESWVESVSARRHLGSRTGWTRIGPGENRIPWDSDWQLDRPLELLVTSSTPLSAPTFLVPLYGPVDTNVPLGFGMPQWAWTPGEVVTVPAGAPRPALLLACSVDPAGVRSGRGASGIRVLDDVPAEGRYEIPNGVLSLTWPADVAWEGPYTVTCEQSGARMRSDAGRAAAHGGRLSFSLQWSAALTLRIDGLSEGNAAVRVQGKDFDWTGEVQLRGATELMVGAP